ncbi:hypothetical protein SAMN02949497_1696 [Methylomagnum ishizawai]|uniref:Double-GTPase 2 domain-containing protein n=1 Tax=Methylomagnum ishizawai TaxID=1760988 RepID=A0A1Y6D0M7_9GAMM|nr:hypothetical protein [Methylomagnum ishizawai]SMF94383.1 hypothetical protein SAMN02949497_1696 [Methylomagnum ishizawai]
MNPQCQDVECYAHEGESCRLGEVDHTQCAKWTNVAPGTEPETATPSTPAAARVCWSGSALGLADIANLTPRARSILIGVLGAYDAGKTTLLIGNYLQLLRGNTLADAHFAGSRTLGAWESLAAWTRYDDVVRPPRFPPHTPRGTSRVPGLLHFALRGAHDEFRDILLTDAPGEWFTRWAIKTDAPGAEGACWIAEKADAFLVFADCARLSGPKRGEARDDLCQLLERLGNEVSLRPTALVWAKDDQTVPERIQDTLRKVLNERIPQATEVRASITRPQSLVDVLASVIRPAWTAPLAKPLIEPVLYHHAFAAFRGHHASA